MTMIIWVQPSKWAVDSLIELNFSTGACRYPHTPPKPGYLQTDIEATSTNNDILLSYTVCKTAAWIFHIMNHETWEFLTAGCNFTYSYRRLLCLPPVKKMIPAYVNFL